jgi:hypothetical protein
MLCVGVWVPVSVSVSVSVSVGVGQLNDAVCGCVGACVCVCVCVCVGVVLRQASAVAILPVLRINGRLAEVSLSDVFWGAFALACPFALPLARKIENR